MEKPRSGTTADEIAEIDRQIAALEEEERASGQRATCDHGKARKVKKKPLKLLTVVPDVYRMMKKNTELNIDCDITAEQRAKGVIAMVDGMDVIKMTAKKMPERAGFMISHPVATVAPTKLEDYKIHQDPPGISGELVEGRIVYDAFVLDNKKMAIYYVENKAAE